MIPSAVALVALVAANAGTRGDGRATRSDDSSSLPHYLLPPTPEGYPTGLAIGQVAKQRIQRYLQLSTLLPRFRTFAATARGRMAVQRLLAAAEGAYPVLVAELRGTADGAGVAFDDLLLLTLDHELSALLSGNHTSSVPLPSQRQCTDVASIATDGSKLLGHNEDGDHGLSSCAFVATVQPYITSGFSSTSLPRRHHRNYSFTSFFYPSSLAGHSFAVTSWGGTSMNALFPTRLNLDRPGNRFVLRDVLAAPNASDALRRALQPCAFGFSLNVVGPGRLFNLEVAPAEPPFGSVQSSLRELSKSGTWEFHMNQYLRLQVAQRADPSSAARMAQARKLVSEEGPPVSPQLVRSIIGSSPIIHRSSTQASVVFDLANCHAMIWFEVSAAMPQIPTLVVPIRQCV